MLDLKGIPSNGISKEEYRELVQSKAKSIYETLKGVTYEQSRDVIWIVKNEIENKIKKTKLE